MVDVKDYETKTVRIVAAVSAENGLEVLDVHDEYINSVIFSQVVTKVKKKGARFVLFGDNVSYHHSKWIQEVYKENDTEMLLSVGWCPMLNPIENFFLHLKNKVK